MTPSIDVVEGYGFFRLSLLSSSATTSKTNRCDRHSTDHHTPEPIACSRAHTSAGDR